jgi:hypothetical protein
LQYRFRLLTKILLVHLPLCVLDALEVIQEEEEQGTFLSLLSHSIVVNDNDVSERTNETTLAMRSAGP